jgi:autotransporter-associated beta strand protein
MIMFSRKALMCAIVALCLAMLCPLPAQAVYIDGVLPAAMDQPMINCYVSLSSAGAPLSNPDGDPEWGLPYFTITGYFDTGASGILLSYETADYLSVPKSYSGGNLVVYEDVGVGGSEQFNVSQPVYIALAGNPNADLDNNATYQISYDQKFGPIRTQIATTPVDPFSLLGPIDVVGIPAMAGKVVVIDPKPLDDIFLFAGINTYVYNPGTTYRPATADTDPGIPATNRHVRLSYASFDSFTKVTPSIAAGPTMAANPFIGPNPVAKLYGQPVDNTPGVTISLGSLKATGSFLFDTGASTSMISTALAAALHVRYQGESQTSGVLELFDPARPGWSGTIPNQFTMEVGGVGGTVTAAGFYLDSMLLRALEGDPNNDADPNHLVYRNVPVLVDDISVQNPVTLQTLTLDGIFGVNNYVAGMTPDLTDMGTGNFNWITFNQPKGLLGLDVKSIPSATWSGSASPSDATWSNAANWGDVAAGVGAALSFGQISPANVANNNDFPAGTRFAGINFDGNAAFNLQGNRIALAGAIVNLSTQTQIIGLDMTLTDSACVFFADANNIVVNGHIDGDQGLVKTGGAKLILNAANTYTGPTTVREGTLTLDGGSLSVSSAISVDSGATLEVLNGTHTLGTISGSGTTQVDAGASLTAASISQGALTIGSGATVTIQAIPGGPVAVSWKGGASSAPTDWGLAANWISNALPAGAGIKVSFGNQDPANNVVDMISIGRTIGSIDFFSTTSTIIQSSGGFNLTLDNAGIASVVQVEGNHSISAPVVLDNDIEISGKGMLNLSGGIGGPYTMNVLGGNLTANSINVNTLTIGSGATVTIQAIPGGPSGYTIAPVPEPSTLVFLGFGAISLIGYTWRRRKHGA